MSAILMMMTPPPPPKPRPIVSNMVSCDMHAVDGVNTPLTVALDAVPILVNGRDELVYRWVISGDDERYPSPSAEQSLRDYENVWIDYSTKTVTRDRINHTYTLHYDQRSRAAPKKGYLIVERWPVGPNPMEPFAIGFCKITQSETVQ